MGLLPFSRRFQAGDGENDDSCGVFFSPAVTMTGMTTSHSAIVKESENVFVFVIDRHIMGKRKLIPFHKNCNNKIESTQKESTTKIIIYHLYEAIPVMLSIYPMFLADDLQLLKPVSGAH